MRTVFQVPLHAVRPPLWPGLCAVFFLCLLLGGCAEDASPPVQTMLVLLGEDRFTGTINGHLTRDLQVLVIDYNDEPVPGVVVNFVVVGGLPLEITPSDTTDAMGIAEADVTLGGVPGETLVLAVSPGLIGSPLSLTIETTPYLLRLSGPQDELRTVGEPLENPVMALLSDGEGNRIAGATITFTPVHGSVSDSSVVTAADGRAFTEWSLGPRPGYQMLKASHEASEATLGVEAIPGPPDHLVKIWGDRQIATWNEELSEPLRVRLVDHCENGLSGLRVYFGVTGGNGSLRDKHEFTDSEGVAWARYVPSEPALVHRISVSSSGATGAEFIARTFAPVNLQTAEITPTAARISWNEIPDPEVRRIDILRSEDPEAPGTRIASLSDPTLHEFTDTAVNLFDRYFYRLRVQLEDEFQYTSAVHGLRIGPEFRVPDFGNNGFELHVDGSRGDLYVSTDAGDLAVVSPQTLRIVDHVDLGGARAARGMVSDAGLLLVVTEAPDRLQLVNPDTRMVETSIDIPNAWDMAALPRNWVVTSPVGSGNLQVVRWIDPTLYKPVNPELVLNPPAWLELSEDANTLFVLDGSSQGRLRAVDISTFAAFVIRDLVVGAEGLGRFAVHGDRILLRDGRYLNASDFALVHDFGRTGVPVIHPDGTRAYLGYENGVVELDLQSLSVRRTISHAGPLSDMAVNAERTGLWLMGPRDIRLLLFPP